MANYQYSSDLIDAALFHAGEPTDGTSDYEAAVLRYINDAYSQICISACELNPDIQEDWWWLLTTDALFLNTEYDTGTVALTQDSSTATLSAAPSISLAGYWLLPNDTSTPYKITAHTASTTTLTLDESYAGDTAAAASYKAFQSDYDLASDVLRLLHPIETHGDSEPFAYMVSLSDMHRDYPLGKHSTGTPKAFAMVDDDTIRFSHHGNNSSGNKIRVDIPYLQRQAALTGGSSEEPAVPLEYRAILAKYAAYKVLVNKNDDRANTFLQEAATRYSAMAEENRRKWANTRRKQGSLKYRPGGTNYRRLKTSNGVTF